MGKIENDKLRRIRNEHFIRAFEHVARCLSMTQGELAEAIGTKTAYISNFRKGIRPVTEAQRFSLYALFLLSIGQFLSQ